MRKCTRCGADKTEADFYVRFSYCKDCQRVRDKGRVRSDPRNPTRNVTENARTRKRRWQQAHYDPLKTKVRMALRRAVEKGIIAKPNRCEKCGVKKKRQDGRSAIQGHHADYSKPLVVNWLCTACHRGVHSADAARKEPK